ncbi:MAG: hypothetical protein WAO55_10525 [Candidatus Manganitrophaceae bacterium]
MKTTRTDPSDSDHDHHRRCGGRHLRDRWMNAFLQQMKGGDRRSIGAVPEVVKQVITDPSLFPVLFDGMTDPDPLIRMRCADAIEKITAGHPEYLSPYKRRLIQLAGAAKQQEVRWHMAQLLSRLELSRPERRRVVEILSDYLVDTSKIVKTFSMQTLADIAAQDLELRGPIIARLEKLTRTGSPAMKSRGRKLLARLKQPQNKPTTAPKELESPWG